MGATDYQVTMGILAGLVAACIIEGAV
jgi:hypothetical protein